MWIGSVFLEPENMESFVYKMIPRGNLQADEAAQENKTEAAEAAGKIQKKRF
jgi:hypothetical protein